MLRVVIVRALFVRLYISIIDASMSISLLF